MSNPNPTLADLMGKCAEISDAVQGVQQTLTIGLADHVGSETAHGVDAAKKAAMPKGGKTKQVLSKRSDNDFDTEWTAPDAAVGVITDHSDLTGRANADQHPIEAISGLGQALAELGSRNVPPGGTPGQILAKRSQVNNDVEWIDPPEGGGSGPGTSTGGVTDHGELTGRGNAGAHPIESISGLESSLFTLAQGIVKVEEGLDQNTDLLLSIAGVDAHTDPVFGICRISTGGKSGLWFNTDRHGNPKGLTQGYFNGHPVYAGIQRCIIDGQIMNRVPKFYVRHGTIPEGKQLAGRPVTYISPTPQDGFHIHPAFINDGDIIDQFFLGCFSVSDAGSSMAGSLSGRMPLVSINFGTMKDRCANRNRDGVDGFMLVDIYQWAAIQLLMLAEFANPDMQVSLGAGWTATSNTGAIMVDDHRNHRPWRNFHALFGNVWQMVDGLRADGNRRLEIFRNDGTRAFVNTNLALPTANGWIVDMLTNQGVGFDLRDVFVPNTTNATETNGSYGDHHWAAVANGVLYMGGTWNNGSNAGVFYTYLHNVASDSSTAIGGRLAKV